MERGVREGGTERHTRTGKVVAEIAEEVVDNVKAEETLIWVNYQQQVKQSIHGTLNT